MTGLRRGELLALRWQDIDRSAGLVRVRRNFTRGRFGTPKSRRSSRAVPLAARVGRELQRHFERTAFRDVLEAGKELHLLTEESLGADYPEFDLGAVPPLGGRRDEVVLDSRLARLDDVVFEAGVHDSSARVRTADLVALARARVADVCAN